MTPYKYSPIPTSNTERHYCRLMDIFPSGDRSDPLKVQLRIVEIEDAPRYECLSYVWGTTPPDCEVTVLEDGDERGHLQIRHNVNDALRALRFATQPRTIWVDAICINQEDLAERSSQVSLMGLIYWCASQVDIWLGPDPRGLAKVAFDTVKPISDAQWRHNGSTPRFTPEEAGALDASIWICVTHLYRNPWFERAWVQQELGLAEQAYFYWGETPPVHVRDVFGFDVWMECIGDPVRARFIGDASGIRGARNLWLQYGRATRASWPAKDDQARREYMKMNPFLTILLDGSNCNATDPRDHVYAFLGHPAARRRDAYAPSQSMDYRKTFKDGSQTLVVPDYEKSVEEVYLEVAKALLRQHNDLRLLGAVSHTTQSLASDYPSWVPRWNSHHRFKDIGCWPFAWPNKIEVAGVQGFQLGNRELKAHGLIIGSVSSLIDWTQGRINETNERLRARRSISWGAEYMPGRRLFRTADGREGLVQYTVRAGDHVVILVGGYTPCVLRQVEASRFKLVGTCTMFDLVDDELSNVLTKEKGKLQDIILV